MPHLIIFLQEGTDDTMRTMYKPSEYEMKLIVLFVIKYLRTGATYTILDYIISSVVDMDYFVKYEAVSYFVGDPDDARNNYNNHYVYFLPSSGNALKGKRELVMNWQGIVHH